MLTKPEFVAALTRERRILSHLAGRLEQRHLAFRFTPPQRSTLELLQYLTINVQAHIGFFLSGSWDHWDALEAASTSVTLTSFPAALRAQQRVVAKLLAPVSDKAFLSRSVPLMMGRGRAPLSTALAEITMTQATGYRMQLFLQAKAAGIATLGSSDLWAGRTAKAD